MRCLKSRFPIQIIVFDELELFIIVSQGLTLSTASLVLKHLAKPFQFRSSVFDCILEKTLTLHDLTDIYVTWHNVTTHSLIITFVYNTKEIQREKIAI